MAWCISQGDPHPLPPQKTFESWHCVSAGDARTLSMALCISQGDPHPLSPQSGSGASSPGASVQLLQQEDIEVERVSEFRTSAVIRIEQQQSGSITARKATRARYEMGSWRITGACSMGRTTVRSSDLC